MEYGGFGKILGGYIAGLMISWQLTLILVGFGFVKIFADRWIMRPIVEMTEKRNAAANKIFSNILQFLEGLLFFRLTANQDKIKKSFDHELEQYKNIVVSVNSIQVCMDTFGNLIELAVILSVIGIGAVLYINQVILLGAYVSLISLYDFFVNPYKFVSNFIHMKRRFSVGCVKVFGLLKITENVNRNQEQINLSGRIYLETSTGMRFNVIDSPLVTYVSQTPFLFPGSIAENIALCEESDMDLGKIKYALEKSYSRNFVEKLPGESNYIIQDNSKNLSGGEKGRIALARAFYKPTPIILLDEVYASLD